MLAPGKFVRVARAGSGLVAPLVVVTAPAGIVFVRFPLTVIVALRVNVQRPNAGRLPPLNENELSPGIPVSVPPQVPTLKWTGLARIISCGILSVKAIPSKGVVPELINSMLIVEAEPPKTSLGSKPLTTAIASVPPLGGGVLTVRFAVSGFAGTRFSVF